MAILSKDNGLKEYRDIATAVSSRKDKDLTKNRWKQKMEHHLQQQQMTPMTKNGKDPRLMKALMGLSVGMDIVNMLFLYVVSRMRHLFVSRFFLFSHRNLFQSFFYSKDSSLPEKMEEENESFFGGTVADSSSPQQMEEEETLVVGRVGDERVDAMDINVHGISNNHRGHIVCHF